MPENELPEVQTLGYEQARDELIGIEIGRAHV